MTIHREELEGKENALQILRNINLIADTSEEKLPNFDPAFPCVTSQAELHSYPGAILPWHWHPTAELFYVAEGALTYHIPGGNFLFTRGMGGLLLPEMIHKTTWDRQASVVQRLHLFYPSLLFGEAGARMEQKYVRPMLNASPLISLNPRQENHVSALSLLEASFGLNENDYQYEFRLREALCEIWLRLLEIRGQNEPNTVLSPTDSRMKNMLTFIHAHISEKLTVQAIAGAAFVSARACYRMFRDALGTTPNAYITSCRIRNACVLLNRDKLSVTEAAQRCGFEDSGYFGRVFREYTGLSPSEFKKMAQ
ncbi:MAG: helix-turn-helix domain-containing protein [Clostridia bacterium]|nr:helix-turn-helix domain-containing protein [Clostridia bacterium]